MVMDVISLYTAVNVEPCLVFGDFVGGEIVFLPHCQYGVSTSLPSGLSFLGMSIQLSLSMCPWISFTTALQNLFTSSCVIA